MKKLINFQLVRMYDEFHFLQGWKVYDSNPKTIKCPLICLLPVSGTADIYFKQILGLSAKGYRVISVSNVIESLINCNINIDKFSYYGNTHTY